jgi:transcription antitermination factor NusG
VNWYALTVRPRHERSAARLLHQKGFEEFLPTYLARRRWSDRIKRVETNLFPGYLFCRFPAEDRSRVLATPGVTSIVAFGKNPAPVPAQEVEAVRAVVASGLPVEPWPFLRAGDRVRIEEGCLAGLVGTFVGNRDAARVVVNVEILQRAVAVEVDRSWIGRLARTRA